MACIYHKGICHAFFIVTSWGSEEDEEEEEVLLFHIINTSTTDTNENKAAVRNIRLQDCGEGKEEPLRNT